VVTRERLYLDMMQSVLGNSSKVLIDQKAGNSLLYLPLDQLLRQSQPAASAPPVADSARPATPAPEATVTLDPTRGRDISRDRGPGR
jgi:membrane protease subunit HflK